jgi:peptide deformylase
VVPYSTRVKDPVVQDGEPVLRLTAKPVLKKDIASAHVRGVIARMKKVLTGEEFGVAIAAPQVGESLRIFVIAGKAFTTDEEKKGFETDTKKKTPPDMVFINPEIIRLSKKTAEMSEGCLSVRQKYGTVLRHEKAAIKALDEQGKPFTYNGSGLIAHIFQHEYDHLEGILYIDKAIKLVEDVDLKSARQKLSDSKLS